MPSHNIAILAARTEMYDVQINTKAFFNANGIKFFMAYVHDIRIDDRNVLVFYDSISDEYWITTVKTAEKSSALAGMVTKFRKWLKEQKKANCD